MRHFFILLYSFEFACHAKSVQKHKIYLTQNQPNVHELNKNRKHTTLSAIRSVTKGFKVAKIEIF